jgi:hypothetical protein
MYQCDLQLIADQVARVLNLTSLPIVKIQPVKRGWAHPKTGKITMPEWVLGKKCRRQAYQKYYVTHEVIHFRTGLKHDLEFKRVEAKVLNKLFGVIIFRDNRRPWPWRSPSAHRIYPTKLVNKKTGEVLWKEVTKPGVFSTRS